MVNSFETTFEEALLADGFSQEEVASEVSRSRTTAARLIQEYPRQREPFQEYVLSQLRRGDVVEILPFLLSQSPSVIDAEQLVERAHDSHFNSAKESLRHLEVWRDLVSQETRAKVLRCILATGDQHAIALYAERFLGDGAAQERTFRDAIMQCLEKPSPAMLPLFSSLPFSDLSREAQRCCLEEPTLQTDDIFLRRHVDQYIGACSFAEESHGETLLGGRLRSGTGNLTLLYVRGVLVGSMKMLGERSILGMRTVEDSQGRYPMVIGGLYATTSAITKAARDVRHDQGTWARLDIEALPLFPLRFLEYDGWKNPRKMCGKVRRIRDKIECPSFVRRMGRRFLPWFVG